MNLASHGLHMDDRVIEFLLAQAACSIDAVQEVKVAPSRDFKSSIQTLLFV